MIFGLGVRGLTAIGATLALVGIVFGAVVAIQDNEDFGTVHAPEWQPGQRVAYALEGHGQYTVESNLLPAMTDSSEFGPIQINKEVLNTEDYSMDGEPVYISVVDRPIGDIMSFQLFEAGLASEDRYLWVERQSDLGVQPYSVSGGRIMVGPENPLPYIQFPLEAGKRWDAEVPLADHIGETLRQSMAAAGIPGIDVSQIATVAVRGEVSGMEKVDLGEELGETKAVRVDISYEPIGIQEAIAELREYAGWVGADIHRLNAQLGFHEVIHYSPEFEVIVKHEFIGRILFDVSVEMEGVDVEAMLDTSFYSKLTMNGIQAPQGQPQLSEDDIMAYLSGDTNLNSAAGKQLPDPEVVYTVDVRADKSVANAADVPDITYSVSLDGVPALPDAHSIEYQLKHLGSGAISSGVGTDMSFTFGLSEPGIYTMTVGALDASDNLIATDKVDVVLNYEATFDEACPGATEFGFTGACDNVVVPLRQGLVSATMTASVTEPVSAQESELVLQVNSRVIRQLPDGDGDYTITHETEGFEDMSLVDGSLFIDQSFGFAEGVQYTVNLQFQIPEEPAAQEGGNGMDAMALPVAQALHDIFVSHKAPFA